MSARSRRTTRRRSIASDHDVCTTPLAPTKLAPLLESTEIEKLPSIPSQHSHHPVKTETTQSSSRIVVLFVLVWGSIIYYLGKIIALPLLPLKHLPSRTYIRRVDQSDVSTLKRELRALEKQLQHEKRRNSMLPGDLSALIPAPAPVATPAPPPPPKMLPPPPPPPPPASGLKMPAKMWRTSTSTETTGSEPVRPRMKVTSAKKGFDISAAQIANIAGRLRKTSAAAPLPKPKTQAQQISPNNLSATLKARMMTRRSSLLHGEVENIKPSTNPSHSPTRKNASPPGFKSMLRKAPVQRSPGGTPYREQVSSKPNLPFNTALADKNITNSPPKALDEVF